jgi:hypothetical protein
MVGDTVPLVQDLAFSPAGDEIWVLSGNNEQSHVAGVRPTQLSLVKLEGGALQFIRSAPIGLAPSPRAMAVSQREAVMAAAAVRSTSQRATMILGSVSNETVSDPGSVKVQGQLMSFDLDGNATLLVEENSIYSEIRLSNRQDQAFASTRRMDAGRSLGLTSVSIEGGEARYLRLADDPEKNPLRRLPMAIAP